MAGNGCGQSSSSLRYDIRWLIDAKFRGFSSILGAFVATQMLVAVGGGFYSTNFLISKHGSE